MRRILTVNLREGMVIAKTIFSPSGRVLLRKDTVIKPVFIESLLDRKVMSVFIRDQRFPDLEPEEVVSDRTRMRVREALAEFREAAQSRSRRALIVASDHIAQRVADIVEEALSHRSVVVNLTDIGSMDDYTFDHSVNVCIISVLAACHMNINAEKIRLLGIGALLHDVGKLLVPPAVMRKPGKLTDEESDVVKNHSEDGYRFLSRQTDLSPLSTIVAYQHHERWDGSGYPLGLKGDEIHQFSQLVGIADVYDALVSDRVYREAFPPHRALAMINGSAERFFPGALVSQFLENLAPYPVGTVIELTNGVTAVVADVQRGSLYHPCIRALTDEDGVNLSESSQYQFELSDHPNLKIYRVIDKDEQSERSISTGLTASS